MIKVIVGVITLLIMACSTAQPTVEQAIEAGWQREVEPCSNVVDWPELYQGVVMERLEDGTCAFYYPPMEGER